jgi:hypothetical protein
MLYRIITGYADHYDSKNATSQIVVIQKTLKSLQKLMICCFSLILNPHSSYLSNLTSLVSSKIGNKSISYHLKPLLASHQVSQ